MAAAKKLMSLVLALALFTASLIHAQAFSVPISDRVIVADLLLPDATEATIEIREGTLVTVQDESRGYIYSFTFFLGKGDRQLRIAPFEVTANGGVDYLWGKRRPQLIRIGQPFPISTRHGDFTFTVTGLKVGSFPGIRPLDPSQPVPSPEELKELYGKNDIGTCCVTCDPITVCGTSVRTWCGSCSSGGSGLGSRPAV